jgi:hypothetical protein
VKIISVAITNKAKPQRITNIKEHQPQSKQVQYSSFVMLPSHLLVCLKYFVVLIIPKIKGIKNTTNEINNVIISTPPIFVLYYYDNTFQQHSQRKKIQ